MGTLEVTPDRLLTELESFDNNIKEKPVTGYADLNQALNLNAAAIALGLEVVEYEPSEFPAMVLPQDDVTIAFFGSGQVFAAGKSEEQISSSVESTVDELIDEGLVDRPFGAIDIVVEPNSIPVPDEYSEVADSTRGGGETTAAYPTSEQATSEEQARCPDCGHRLQGSERYCPQCGTHLETMCSNCGSDLAADANFCSHCGTKVA